MRQRILFYCLFLLIIPLLLNAGIIFETDTISTGSGDIYITFIGHGTLLFEYNGLFIHIDPVNRYADYKMMPKADIILITHHHGDHLDIKTIEKIRKADTKIILTESCFKKTEFGIVINNGEEKKIKDLNIKAVPAYNLVHKRDNGQFYHPKGIGNGYVVTIADLDIYIAGDTENIPEMEKIAGVDIAFLPMNLPYTMSSEMVADAVNLLKPKVLYPYHYGDTNLGELLELLSDNKNTEIRVRDMK